MPAPFCTAGCAVPRKPLRMHSRRRSATATHATPASAVATKTLARGFWPADLRDGELGVTLTKLGPGKWELANSEMLVLGPENDADARAMLEPYLKHFDAADLAKRGGIGLRDGQWTVTVPAGFFFDLGSIPRAARSIIGPQEMLRSSMVHDWMYNLINCAQLGNREEDAVRDVIKELKRSADDVLAFAVKYENHFHGSCSTSGSSTHNARYKDATLHPQFGLSSFQQFAIVAAVRNFGGNSLFKPPTDQPDGPKCSATEGDSLAYQCKMMVPNLVLQPL